MTTTNVAGLRGRIDARRSQGQMLLSIATDETLNEQVRLGLRDLDEASGWLDRHGSTQPADLLLDLAAWRLSTVMQMLSAERAEAATPTVQPAARG